MDASEANGAAEPDPVGLDELVGPSRVRRRAGRRRWFGHPLLVILAVTAVAGGLRFYHLSTPHSLYFDEVYYAKDGCFDAGTPYQECGLDRPGEQTVTVHPPAGREIIAMGERLFGNRSFGWRVASATFGTIGVGLLAVLGYLLFGSALWAGVAGLLLAAENLNFVQSRISMLDVFVATFVIAGFLFLVLDRRWMDRRTPVLPEPPPSPEMPSGGGELGRPDGLEDEEEALLGLPPDRPPSPLFRPWRLGAGVAFGLATATKWSGVTALLAAILLAGAWERTRRARIGLPNPLGGAFRDEAFGIFVFLLMVPLLVYAGTYARWFAHHGLDVTGWLSLQKGMAEYSLHLRATHPYASAAWWWVLMKRPVAYFYQCTRQGSPNCSGPAEILGMGNPLIFWATVITIPYTLVAWRRKRDWRAGLIFTAFSLQYFPWFLAQRTNFLFYMTPITPFMVLAFAYVVKDLSEVRIGVERSRALAPVAGFLVVAAVGLFVFFLPVLTGRVITYAAWKARMWFPTWV